STSHPASSSIKRSLISSSNDDEAFTASSLPSSVHLIFPTPLEGVTHLALTFQGGFAATTATVYVALRPHGDESGIQLGLMMGGKIYPEDKNKRQVFEIPFPPNSELPPTELSSARADLPKTNLGNGLTIVTEIKVEFEKASDSYGRVTLYSIEVLGA
ncbi:hypothetical protein BCR39DRAFT_468216, partial [Naematelia encephala]